MSQASEVLWFANPDDLQRFTSKLGRAFTDGSQCVTWQRRELEIVGDTEHHLVDLEQWGWNGPAHSSGPQPRCWT